MLYFIYYILKCKILILSIDSFHIVLHKNKIKLEKKKKGEGGMDGWRRERGGKGREGINIL